MTIGRRPKSIPSVRKELSLPGDVVAAVDAILFDPGRDCIPLSAWSNYVLELINVDLQARKGEQADEPGKEAQQ